MKRPALCISLWLAALAIPLSTQAAQSALPREVTFNGVELVLIPEGWFYKSGGVTPSSSEEQQRGYGQVRVWLDSFYIAKYEARADHLVELLNSQQGRDLNYDGGEENCAIRKSFWRGYERIRAEEDLPATHLSWNQAKAFATWKGMRLPSEAEWEKAARGEDLRTFPWGNQPPDETYAGFGVRSSCYTWPVDSFKKGRSPYGIHNMSGNVYEYVADWYSTAHDQTQQDGLRNPPGATAEQALANDDFAGRKLLKGGRWASTETQLRIGDRYSYRPEQSFRCYGVRFAMDTAAVLEQIEQGTATVTRD